MQICDGCSEISWLIVVMVLKALRSILTMHVSNQTTKRTRTKWESDQHIKLSPWHAILGARKKHQAPPAKAWKTSRKTSVIATFFGAVAKTAEAEQQAMKTNPGEALSGLVWFRKSSPETMVFTWFLPSNMPVSVQFPWKTSPVT